MKKALMFFVVAGVCLLASCSHNASLLGVGTSFRVGSGEFSMNYADGLFLNAVSRENIKFTAELDSTMGVSYDPTSDTYKGIKGITYEVGPQLGGYARELGEKNPEALKAYYDSLAKYYEYRAKQPDSPAISDEKSKSAIEGVVDAIKEAVSKQREKGEAGKDGDAEDKDDNEGQDDEGYCPTCGDLPPEEAAKDEGGDVK